MVFLLFEERFKMKRKKEFKLEMTKYIAQDNLRLLLKVMPNWKSSMKKPFQKLDRPE